MNTDTPNDPFTQTRSTWLVLTIAGLLWVALCVWAVNSIGFVNNADPVANQSSPSDNAAAEQARLALEAEEEAKLQAQAAAQQRRVAAAEEQARQDAERERLAVVAAEEEAQRLAEQAAAEEAERVAEQAAQAEAQRLAEQAAAEEAERVAEQEAQAEAQRLAEQAAADEAARVAEQEAEEQARKRAQAEADNAIDESARQAAAAEASRVAAVARQQRQYGSLRERELQVLDGLSRDIRFAPGSATVSRDIERLLDGIFNPLYLYSELPVLVSVAGNEYDETEEDGLLSRDRGRAIASYLINRGLEKDRFRILIESGENLAFGTHRVRVSAEEVR